MGDGIGMKEMSGLEKAVDPRKGWGVEAYFTVEAAMILPFVMAFYLLLIYTMFFQYDRCLLEQDMMELVLEGILCEDGSNEEVAQLVERQLAGMDWNRYLAFQPGERGIRVTQGEITLEGEGAVSAPFPQLGKLFDETHWKIRAEAEAARISPRLVIRTCRKILRGGQEG